MRIRKILKKDTEKIINILEEIYGDRKYSTKIRNSLSRVFGSRKSEENYLVAEDKGEVIGIVGYSRTNINYRVYQLFALNVKPTRQKQGIGASLMKAALNEMKKLRRKKGDDIIVMLSSVSPDYYRKHFGFETLMKIKANGSNIMALNI